MKTKLFRKVSRMVACSAVSLLPLSVQAVTVDLLVTYDTHTKTYFSNQPDTAIRNMVDQVNTIYKNSQMDIQLRLVGTMQHDVAKTNMTDVLHAVRQDAKVIAKREELGADFVTQLHQTGNCGVAYVAVLKSYAFGVVGPKCGANTLAHELGHSMGLQHSRRQGNTTGARYAYGLGHGVDGVFVDIMAYPQSYNAPKVPKFSNPNILCNGLPCGVPEGHAEQADAAKAVNNVRTEIAAFMPTKVTTGVVAPTPEPTTTTPTTTTGTVAEGIYALKAKHSGMCANVHSSSTADNARINQWSCHLGNNQRWQLVNAGDGFYEVKAKHSGKCMQVVSAGTANGARFTQGTCAKKTNQLWNIAKNSDGSFRLIAKHSNKVAQVLGSGTANDTALEQWDWISGQNQSWVLDRLE